VIVLSFIAITVALEKWRSIFAAKTSFFSDNIEFKTTEDIPAIEPIDFSCDINPPQDENTQVQFNENLNA
jgi:hypothetical protein